MEVTVEKGGVQKNREIGWEAWQREGFRKNREIGGSLKVKGD